MNIKLNPQDMEDLKALWNKGVFIKKIAKSLNCCQASVTYHRKRLGLKARSQYKNKNSEDGRMVMLQRYPG